MRVDGGGAYGTTTAITHAGDGSGRLFVAEQRGRIFVVQSNAVLLQPFFRAPIADIWAPEVGLLGLAFSPGFATNGHVYMTYTRRDAITVVSRFSISATNANPSSANTNNIVDWTTERVLLEVPYPTYQHQGGNLAFGPDQFLYVSTGDGGPQGDPDNAAQNPLSLFGKILRIDPEHWHNPYGIPPSNPFVGNAAYRPEIWALGLRNPWRFSFDRATGDLYIGDVGGSQYEEVNFEEAGSTGGRNYGWRIREGPVPFNQPTNFNISTLTEPIASYPWQGGAVIGGYVYRGSEFPRMQGIYFYLDYGTRNLYGLKRDGTNWHGPELLVAFGIGGTTFGEDEEGNLYLGSGGIYRLEDAGMVRQVMVGPRGGSYTTQQVVTLSCPTSGASIRYTLDGREPTETDPSVASGATLLITSNLVLKARAYLTNRLPSTVVTHHYNLYAGVKFIPDAGPITNGTPIRIVATPPDAVIRYTIDGSEPDSSSPVYEAPISLSVNTTLKTKAFKANYASPVRTQFFGLLEFENVIVRTIAGTGTPGYAGSWVGDAQFHSPQGIGVDSAGSLYIADQKNRCIRSIGRYSVETFATGLEPGALSLVSALVGLAIHPNGTPYTADSDNNRILRTVWPPVSTGVTYVTHLEINSRGEIFAGALASVLKISSNGIPTRIAGPGSVCCGWEAGVGIGLDAQDNIYAGVGHLIRKINSSGSDQIYAGTQPGHTDGPRLQARFQSVLRDLAVDGQGNVYLTDGRWVRKIGADGVVRTLVALEKFQATAQPMFVAAAGICLDPLGNIYVTDAGAHAIRKLSPDSDYDKVPDNEEGTSAAFLVGRDDRLTDSDGDGASNAAEYIAGTHPLRSESVFVVQILSHTPTTLTLTWDGVDGRIYYVERSEGLNNWTAAAPPINIWGYNIERVLAITNSSMFRVRVELR